MKSKYKIVYGRNSTGCYCNLYAKVLWFYLLDTYFGSSHGNVLRAKYQADEWQEQ